MSRHIDTQQHSAVDNDNLLRDTVSSGKCIFTRFHNRMCAFLIRDNRLTAAHIINGNAAQIGAVYIGKVKNVVKNIDACFVEINGGELCFLPLKDAVPSLVLNRKPDGRILQGDELAVQITREAHKTKQATVTARISFSNEHFAVTLGNSGIGFSKQLDKEQKERIRQLLYDHQPVLDSVLEHCGMVIRTKAGTGNAEELVQSLEDISTDLVSLMNSASHATFGSCILQAPALYSTILSGLAYPQEYSEILTDDKEVFTELEAALQQGEITVPVRLYEDFFPLEKLYALETKIKTALDARIWLKSGAYLVIEPTEALTVIDVNSGKYEAKKNTSEAILQVNLDAAEEIALQLRLRNMSGIIIVDFINMESKEDAERLLAHLRSLVQKDKVPVKVVDITPLGLVEITRKKTYKTFREQYGDAKCN